MAWLDDRLYVHPKWVGLSAKAFRVGVTAICYSHGFGTYGRLEKKQLRAIGATKASTAELIDAGLWEEENGSILIHDWCEHNAQRDAALEQRRESDRKRKSRERETRKAALEAKEAEKSARTSRDSPTDVTPHVTGKSSRAGTRAGPMRNDGVTCTPSSDSDPSYVREETEAAIANDDFMDVVQPLGLTDSQLTEAFAIWKRNPEAVEQLATKALSSSTAKSKPAIFLTELRKVRDDVVSEFVDAHGGAWPTGTRWKRSGAGGTYLQDPLGYDVPNYAVDWGRPSHAEIKRALTKRPGKRGDARAVAVLESARKYVSEEAILKDDKAIRAALKSEFGLIGADVRELLTLAASVRTEEPDLEPEPSLEDEPQAAA
jgi:hypothetical protein